MLIEELIPAARKAQNEEAVAYYLSLLGNGLRLQSYFGDDDLKASFMSRADAVYVEAIAVAVANLPPSNYIRILVIYAYALYYHDLLFDTKHQ